MNLNIDIAAEVPVEIPASALSDDALRAVVDEFIMREGTDYGAEEVEHAVKHKQLLQQVRSGEAKIVFDSTTESITLVPKRK